MATTKPRKLSAMDLLLKSDALKPALSQDSALSRNAVANLSNGIPVEISPSACRPWKLADRPANEAGHKAGLVASFQDAGLGQLQPVIVRPVQDAEAPEIQYEVVCGCVRWMAAKELGILLKAIVRELSDQEAYAVMSTENRQRQNLSDWAKAKSYRRALDLAVFAGAGQLAEAEGISKSKLSLYLGFADLPGAVADAFADITRLSYRTGYALARAAKAQGAEAFIPLVPRIESGEIGRDELERMATPDVPTAADTGGMAQSPPGGLDGDPCPVPADDIVESNAEPGLAAVAAPTALPLEAPRKKALLSASGQRLFSYHPAARGWLIRIDPGISARIDEDLMLEIGRLIEAKLALGGGSA